MSVWVQSRSGNEEAFKVDFNGGMDFDQLKKAITHERDIRHLPAGAVQSIHTENSDDERFKLKAGAKVPIPVDGQIGSSDDLPYFFSIAQTQAGADRTPQIVQFELLPINNVGEAASIRPDSPLGSLVPMGAVVPGFHSISTSDAVEASGLHHHLHVFMQNRVGDGENGCISRNDGILVPLHLLVGCTAFGRDVHYFSTPLDTRPDFTGLYNSVQVIVAEEKDDDIKAATADIMSKFRFVYNYSNMISVMFGFAISRNDFRIFKFERNFQSELPRVASLWFSSTLHSEYHRVNCILAALNVGRVLKFYRDRDLLVPAAIPRGTWVQRAQGHKQIKICYDHMIVKSTQDEARLLQLKEFYKATTEVVNLEHLFLGKGKSHPDGFNAGSAGGVTYLEIYLKPVGQTVFPSSPVQLKTALLCILRCVKQLHSLGYFHTDIRWFNIVLYGVSWILIDCYDFCEAADHERRVATKRQRTAGAAEDAEWCAADDLSQVVALSGAEQFQDDAYNVFAGVRAAAASVAAGETSVDDVINLVEQVVV